VQVIRHHDGGKARLAERPGAAVFQIGAHEPHPRDLLRLAVQRYHLEAALGEEERVAPRAASHVEHRPALHEVRPAQRPRRGLQIRDGPHLTQLRAILN
jgi:hypothetical protein